MRRLLIVAAVLVCALRASADAPVDVGASSTSSGASGELAADLGTIRDGNTLASPRANRMSIRDNHVNLTPDPTCANQSSNFMTWIDTNETSGVFDPTLCAGSSTWFDVPNTGASVIANGQTLLGTGSGAATYGKVDHNYLNLGDTYPITGVWNVADGALIGPRNTDSTCTTIGILEAQQCWATDKDILYVADGSGPVWLDPYKLQAVTVSSNGTGTPATFNLDPTSRYIEVTCNDTDGCDGTLQETSAKEMRHVTVLNVSANRVRFNDVTNVLTLVGGTLLLNQWGATQLVYEGTRWLEIGNGMRVGTTVPSTCAVGDPLYFDTDALPGQRLQLCVATNTWVGVDSAIGSEVDASEMAATLVFAGQEVDLNTNSGNSLRLPITASNPASNGSIAVDSTSPFGLKWYASGAVRGLSDYAYLPGRAGSQSLYGGDSSAATLSLNLFGANRSDGSDDGILNLNGGGAASNGRGAGITLYGNEAIAGIQGGNLVIAAGNVSPGVIYFNTASSSTRMAIENDGSVCLGGIATCAGTIGIDGTAARTFGMENHSTAGSAGNTLTINAGGSGTSSNLNGGDLVLASGRATGNGGAKLDFQTVDSNQGTGTTTRAAATRFRLRDGHVVALGTAPTVATCGTSPSAVTGTDTAGYVTTGTGTVNSCAVTFAKAFTTNKPACTLFFTGSANGIRPTSVSTSGFTATFSASSPSLEFGWTCVGME